MGDPRKKRKKYQSPKKLWDKTRLDAEKIITREYGVVNKKEIYRMRSLLRKFSSRAKQLMSVNSEQAMNEKKALLSKMNSFALVGADAQLDDVLALELKNIMERRLQTLLVRKALANTMKQARQMITHRHIRVGDKIITSPSFIVSKEQEASIAIRERSPFANPEHPERPESIFKLKEAKKIKKTAPVEVQEEKSAEVAEEPKEETKSEEKVEEKKETAISPEIEKEIEESP
ncbi:30S ribosomal protein S4 [Candidatus Woesearchaeota archaeon]|nr:30S ribosomal protein S4 [Candidatus Woesearchaeota archaeon]